MLGAETHVSGSDSVHHLHNSLEVTGAFQTGPLAVQTVLLTHWGRAARLCALAGLHSTVTTIVLLADQVEVRKQTQQRGAYEPSSTTLNLNGPSVYIYRQYSRPRSRIDLDEKVLSRLTSCLLWFK